MSCEQSWNTKLDRSGRGADSYAVFQSDPIKIREVGPKASHGTCRLHASSPRHDKYQTDPRHGVGPQKSTTILVGSPLSPLFSSFSLSFRPCSLPSFFLSKFSMCFNLHDTLSIRTVWLWVLLRLVVGSISGEPKKKNFSLMFWKIKIIF